MSKNVIKNIGKAILIFFLFYFSYIFQYIPVLLFNIDVKNISDSMSVVLSTFSNIVLLLILVLIFFKDLKREWKIFKEKLGENLDIGFRYWFLGLIGMMVSNIIITFVFKGGQAGNEETVQTMITALPWLMLIDAGLLAPIIEEIVFRKTFKDAFKNKWVFVFTSGVFFGLLHIIGNVTTWTDILFIVPYSCLGISFALCYQKTNSIYTPIFMHMFHNTALTLLSILV